MEVNSKGMELMLKMAVKMLNIDGDALLAQLSVFTHQVAGKVKEFDLRLYDLEQQNAQLTAQNAEFIALLRKAYPEVDAINQAKESEK